MMTWTGWMKRARPLNSMAWALSTAWKFPCPGGKHTLHIVGLGFDPA